MPHFTCLACQTRLYSAAGPENLVGDLCPDCGSLLVSASASGTHGRIADRFGDFITRHPALEVKP